MRRFLRSIALILLNLGTSPVPLSHKGIVVVQIDGLGFGVLNQAIKRGYAPFLQSLIQKDGYILGGYFCGIPSITTAVEAQLMYGTNEGVAGYSWFDRQLGRFVRGDAGVQMRAFEAHAFSHIPHPLIKDGSCITGAWSGGATMTNFSAQTLADKSPLHRLVKFRALLVPLLNPIRFITILGIIMRTAIVSIFRAVRARSKSRFRETMLEMLLRIVVCDMGSSVAQIELLRHTPALFINYPLVDFVSHKHATTHALVFHAIRLVDTYCRKIYESARAGARSYEIFFLSDHGQSDAIPFEDIAGDTITDLATRGLDNLKRTVCFTYGNDKPLKENMAGNSLFIVPSSSIAHLYFSEYLTTGATRADIEKRFPKLTQTLLAHPGIGWILLREGDGKAKLLGKHRIEGPNRQRILSSLTKFAREKNNGDLVLFGAIYKGKSVTFEPYRGTHGGFTGEMVEAFLLTNHPRLTHDLKMHRDMQTLFARIRALRH